MKLNQEIAHISTAQKDYVKFLGDYLSPNPDALLWVLTYTIYVHAIDDIIDGDKDDSEHILKTFELAAVVYSNVFYRENIHLLYSLVVTASNTYMDSVMLENSTETWKQKTSDHLRQNGNELILMCIQIVGGIEKRREASLKLRDISFRNHHTTTGQPV